MRHNSSKAWWCALAAIGLIACEGQLQTDAGSGDATPGRGVSPEDGVAVANNGGGGGGGGKTPDDGGQTPSDDPGGEGEEDDPKDQPSTPHVPSGNELTWRQQELFTCDAGAIAPSPARLRLVDRSEWKRNVSLNKQGAGIAPFDPLSSHPYATFVEGEGVNEEVLDVYINMSSVAADAWKGPGNWDDALRWSSPFKKNPMLVEQIGKISCLIDERKGTPDDACLTQFATILLEKAVLYRPASQEEITALVGYGRRAIGRESDPPTREERASTVRQIIQAAWMTSGALFKAEGMGAEPDAQGVSPMTPWEIAHALGYALGQSAPGAVYEGSSDASGAMPEIVSAAQDGTLSDPETIGTLIALYASHDQRTSDQRAAQALAPGVQAFFREWLGYMAYRGQTKDDPHATTQYEDQAGTIKETYHFAVNGPRHSGSSYEPMLFEQLDDTIARIVHEDRDVFRELLTTREYYVAADVGKDGGSPHMLYNLSSSTSPTQDGRWVKVPAGERAGVLTHPAWLASHSLNFENDPNPVHRGRWVREHLLCDDIPPTPVTVEAALDPETRDQNTRARVKHKTDHPECAGCHAKMNPIGYTFEIYNHIGILRDDDHGSAPDGSSDLVQMFDPALEGPVRDAVEMSEKMAESQFVKRCFIRQTFRYFMGRYETMQDACLLSQLEQVYDQDGSFKQMLIALFTSPAFMTRQHPVAQEEGE